MSALVCQIITIGNNMSDFTFLPFSDQVKKLWGVDKNISFAKKTNADKWI